MRFQSISFRFPGTGDSRCHLSCTSSCQPRSGVGVEGDRKMGVACLLRSGVQQIRQSTQPAYGSRRGCTGGQRMMEGDRVGVRKSQGDRLTFFWPRHGSIRKPSGGHHI